MLGKLLYDHIIVFPAVRFHTVHAGLDAAVKVREIASALFSETVERAITKQTVEILRMVRLMTGKILAFLVLKKLIMFHLFCPRSARCFVL